MSEVIKSGVGTPWEMRVDENHRAVVSSNAQTEEHFISSAEGLSFFANTTDTDDTLTTTVTGGPMMYIKNDHSSKQLIISKILASSDTANGVITFTKNPTLTSIGNNNTHTPVNINFGANLNALTTIYTWNEAGDGMTGLSGGTKIKTFIMPNTIVPFPIESAFVLEKDSSFMISYKGVAEFEVGVRFFFMNKEVL